MTPDSPVSVRSRSIRWWGVVRLAGSRLVTRATRTAPRRTGLTIAVVAIAIASMLIVTSISLGLATQTTVRGEDIEYWIVPESGTTLTTFVTVNDPQLGNVHPTSSTIGGYERVDTATPVLIELVQMRAPKSDGPEYVLAIGVIPRPRPTTIGGVSTASLTPGDPYFAAGTYDGTFTGEVVLSPTAATLLNASSGAPLTVSSSATGARESSFTVTATGGSGLQTIGGQIPVAVFHLSELQALTGASDGDLADQILVSTASLDTKPALERVYPEATVLARTGLASRQLANAELPLAVSVLGLVIALAIGVLFVTTTTALEIETDREQLAVLAVLGFSARAQSLLVVSTTVLLALCGAGIGLVVAAIGISAINLLSETLFGPVQIAILHPLFGVYALAVAIVIGLLAAPYPVLLARRTNTLGNLVK